MAKVRKDILGLYIKSGGYIARPSPSPSPETLIKEGDTVKARHVGGTCSHTIKKDEIKESWESSDLLDSDEYTFAKNHYFNNKKEFESFLLKMERAERLDVKSRLKYFKEVCEIVEDIRKKHDRS